MFHVYLNWWVASNDASHIATLFNSLRPSDAYMRQWSNHHWFRQTNAGILLTWPLGTNFSELSIEIYTFSFKKIHLIMSSEKWRPFCLSLIMLKCFHGLHYNMSKIALRSRLLLYTVYPKKYAHGFVVLCFVVVMQSFIMNSSIYPYSSGLLCWHWGNR